MLEFYCGFLDRFIYRHDFQLIQMNTDSDCIAIYAAGREDVVRPDMRAEFEATEKWWPA